MENFKSILFSIIILGVLSLGIYWAISTIQSGSEYDNSQEKYELIKKNENLEKEILELKSQISALESKVTEVKTVAEVKTPAIKTTETLVKTTTTLKHQDVINNLQKLIADNINLKEGSQGTRVGVVQTFLNIYNKTSNRVDNDYGATTKKDIMAFQKAEGLLSDGEAGPNTFRKMIDWLKKQ